MKTETEAAGIMLDADNTCAGCGSSVYVSDGMEFNAGDLCYECQDKRIQELENDRKVIRECYLKLRDVLVNDYGWGDDDFVALNLANSGKT